MSAKKFLRLLLIPLALFFCQIDSNAQQPKPENETWKALLYYGEADLWKLDKEDSNKIRALVDKILPTGKNSKSLESNFWRPWFLWRVSFSSEQSIYVLLEGQQIVTIPGQSEARVHFLSADGNHIRTSEFSTGWRIALKDARIIRKTAVGYPMIEISTQPDINGREIHRQYYALKGTEIFLVRLETAEGKIVRNDYTAPNLTVGPYVPRRSPQMWKDALASNDLAEVLQALIWLGGRHVDTQRGSPFTQLGEAAGMKVAVEDIKDAKLAESVRSNREVRKILAGLAKSEKRWILEAAELALKPAGESDDY